MIREERSRGSAGMKRRGVVVGEEWPSDLRVVEPDSDNGSGRNHMLAGELVSRTGTMDRVCMISTRGVFQRRGDKTC